MRRALVLSVVLLSLARLDRARSKALLRRGGVAACRGLFACFGRGYHMDQQATVVFAPHQDDETLGCGALIARKRSEGWPVHVVFLTDGRASHPGHPSCPPAELARVRRAEAERALAALGVESRAVHFLNAPDGMLDQLPTEEHCALVRRMADVLVDVKPNKILVPFWHDGSTEHDAAFRLICEALAASKVPCQVWQYPIWAWWNAMSLLRLALLAPRSCRQPTEDFGPAKLAAIRCYASQTRPLPPWTKSTLPPELVDNFLGRNEYFFRYELPPCPATWAEPHV